MRQGRGTIAFKWQGVFVELLEKVLPFTARNIHVDEAALASQREFCVTSQHQSLIDLGTLNHTSSPTRHGHDMILGQQSTDGTPISLWHQSMFPRATPRQLHIVYTRKNPLVLHAFELSHLSFHCTPPRPPTWAKNRSFPNRK